MEWVLGLVEGLCSFVQLSTLTSGQKLEKRLTVSDIAKFESSDWVENYQPFCMVVAKLVPQPAQRELGQCLLNMCCWLLTTPLPHYSLFCGQLCIDPVLVTFAQM